MPRVTFVKSARKANPVAAVGESYYWWKFRYGGKRFSKTYPRGSQLTQSAYFGGVRELVERIEDADIQIGEYDTFIEFRDEIVSDIRQLGEEASESRDNMPEGLQEGDTGQMLEARYEACEQAASEIEYMEPEGWEDYTEEKAAFEEWHAAEPDCDVDEQEYIDWQDAEVDDPDDTVEEFDKSEMIDLISSCEDCY